VKRHGFYSALFLLLAVNALVLGGIAYNRSGTADANVELTERELPLNPADSENSGMSLRIDWRRYDGHESQWFDRSKLVSIGYDCALPVDAADAERHYAKALSRKTFVVLEYEGKSWETWKAREMRQLGAMEAGIARGETAPKELAKAKKRLELELVTGSRLFAVDAGNDPEKLRKAYPDGRRFIIAAARVRLNYRGAIREKGKPAEPPALRGIIEDVLTDTIQVPRDRQGLLRSLELKDGRSRPNAYSDETSEKPTPPRYRAILSFGRRHEPWVVAVRPY